MNMKGFIIFLIFLATAIYSTNSFTNNEGKPVVRTNQDTLSFLVKNSNLIAIVSLSGGVEKTYKPTLFNRPPKKVKGIIERIIKGSTEKKEFELLAEPKHRTPDSIYEFVLLKNGKHLVFLSIEKDQYRLTTGSSLLDILYNKVYPTWRDDHYKVGPDGVLGSYGVDLEEVVSEIKEEINKS